MSSIPTPVPEWVYAAKHQATTDRLWWLVREIAGLERDLSESLIAETTSRVNSYESTPSRSIAEADRLADSASLTSRVEIIRLRSELAALRIEHATHLALLSHPLT